MGWCAFARHYLRNHCCFLFLRVLRCFSSPGMPRALRGTILLWWVAPFGNPCFIAGICPWARLIAACHVLLRLREPRHPSCALFSFPFSLKSGSDSFAFLRLPRRRSVSGGSAWVVVNVCVGIELLLCLPLFKSGERSLVRYVLIL